MKVSINWAQFYSNVDLKSIGQDELTHRIGAQLGAIEDVVEWGPRYDGIIVAKVASCINHEGADKLNVCRIDDGGVVQDVERGEDGLVQVVCGAPNVTEGMTVAWLPPGTIVPSTIGSDPFTLEVREIRGVKSNGMLASASELGISDDHAGLLEIKALDVGEELMKPGTPFKQLYGLDDTVYDLENKMFTHRPDCFGILGVARELAGISGMHFDSPEWYVGVENEKATQEGGLSFSSKNEIPEFVPRFTAQVVENVQIMPSPIWMQAAFVRVGLKPINNIVDWTNYYSQLTAQPTHAFDYDKVKALCDDEATIFPRMARDGEELTLLGNKKVKLTADDIVISTDKHAIALAGVMGGADTEVDENTKNIIIECATFDMYTIRRTSMRHGLFTDAVTRYNKGQSPLQNRIVLAKLVGAIVEETTAKPGQVFDSNPNMLMMPQVQVSTDFINIRLGSSLSSEEITRLLTNVEFVVSCSEDVLSVQSPFWRRDIEIAEDVVEEVGRLHGFNKLPVVLPRRSSTPVAKNVLLETKKQLREVLSSAGANEILTYSFVHENLIQKVGQNKENAYHVRNAISPDLQYYRMSLIPSLLDKIHMNVKAGYGEFALFEMNKVHNKDLVEDGLPIEENRLAFVFVADEKTAVTQYSGAPYYYARAYIQRVAAAFGLDLVFEPMVKHDPKMEIGKAAVAPFEPSRSAYVKTATGELIAELGEFNASTRKNLKLPTFSAGFELDIDRLIKGAGKKRYVPLPRFPKVTQDITLMLPLEVTYDTVCHVVDTKVAELKPQNALVTIECLGVYHFENSLTKNITFRLSVSSYDRTLKTEEVSKILDGVAEEAALKLESERV